MLFRSLKDQLDKYTPKMEELKEQLERERQKNAQLRESIQPSAPQLDMPNVEAKAYASQSELRMRKKQ